MFIRNLHNKAFKDTNPMNQIPAWGHVTETLRSPSFAEALQEAVEDDTASPTSPSGPPSLLRTHLCHRSTQLCETLLDVPIPERDALRWLRQGGRSARPWPVSAPGTPEWWWAGSVITSREGPYFGFLVDRATCP